MGRVVYLEPSTFQAEAVALYVSMGDKPASVQHPVVALMFDAGVITPGIPPEDAQVVIPIASIEAVLQMSDDLRNAARAAIEAGSDIDAVGEVRVSLSAGGGGA